MDHLQQPCPTTLKPVLLLLLLVLAGAATSDTVVPSDGDTLLSIKTILSGGSGDALRSWNNTVDFCQWTGVKCGRQPPRRVTALDLSEHNLAGTIPPSLANLTFLTYLNLSYNSLGGAIPPELASLRHLEALVLGHNNLRGSIPPGLGNCSSLAALFLDDNTLSGSIPSSLGNLEALDTINLRFNKLTGVIPTELASIRSLQILDLQFNQISGEIPPGIYNLSNLYALTLSSNLLTGSLPPDMGRNLPNLKYLYLYDNELHGPIPPSIVNSSSLIRIELSKNRFSGRVPPDLGLLRDLEKLNLDSNSIETKRASDWDFLASLGKCTSLLELDLSYNNLSGTIPDALGNLSPKLQWLRLRGNQLSGRIPTGVGNLGGLLVLDMEYNRLTGSIPSTIGKLSKLEALSFRGNMLSGEIPESLGTLSKMSELYLSKNHLSSSIPESLASLHNLQVFDLAYNSLSGPVPGGIMGISALSTFLNLSDNNLSGMLPREIGKLINLRALDVSHNQFNGIIPPDLGSCVLLEYLSMQGNAFNGSIPESFSSLKGLQVLDLSQNRLSGPIPKFLASISSLQFLNLSFNDLVGELPTGGVFGNLSLFSVAGNANLCGGHPGLNLRPCSEVDSKEGSRLSKTSKVFIIVVAAGILLFLLLLALVLFMKYRKAGDRNRPELSESSRFLQLSYADLRSATDDFSASNLIGRGGFGSVYRGVIKQGWKEVAVKLLDRGVQPSLKSFTAECRVLRNVRHRNLLGILTACSTVDFRGDDFVALVYEFMPNGSLDMWLHQDARSDDHYSSSRILSIWQRLGVALDIASALDYLHNHAETAIVHRDLKPSNVLLDVNMTARVGDFGIAKFLSSAEDTLESSTTTGVKGSIGYMPSESGVGGPVSAMWDVYSFGILLLEMFTGKKPTDDSFGEGLSLRKYVERSFPEKIEDIVDPAIVSFGEERTGIMDTRTRECLVSVFGVALACTQESPRERMAIHQALQLLGDIKKASPSKTAQKFYLNV